MLIKIIFLRHVRITWSRKVRRYQRVMRSRKSKTDRYTIANRNDQIVNSLLQKHIMQIRVITKLSNSAQSYKGKVKTCNEIDWSYITVNSHCIVLIIIKCYLCLSFVIHVYGLIYILSIKGVKIWISCWLSFY